MAYEFEQRTDWRNVSQGNPETILFAEDLLRYEQAHADAHTEITALGQKMIVSDTDPGNVPDGTVWIQPVPESSYLDSVPGLLARWQVDKLNAADGTVVSSFAPTAGTWATPLASASGPSLVHSGVNGRKVLAFDGVNDYLDADHPDIAGASTEFIVCNLQTAGTSGGRAISSITSASYRAVRLSSTPGNGGMLTSGTAPNSIYDAWSHTSGWRVVAAVFDGATSRLHPHKRTAIAGATNLALQSDLRLGRGPATSTEYSRIDIADLAIVNGALTDVQIKAVMDELAVRYGQTLGS